jgi:hypothetical protein
MKNALHCLALRLFTKQLVSHGAALKNSYMSSREEIIKELNDGTFYRWRERSLFTDLQGVPSADSDDLVTTWRKDVPQPVVDEA